MRTHHLGHYPVGCSSLPLTPACLFALGPDEVAIGFGWARGRCPTATGHLRTGASLAVLFHVQNSSRRAEPPALRHTLGKDPSAFASSALIKRQVVCIRFIFWPCFVFILIPFNVSLPRSRRSDRPAGGALADREPPTWHEVFCFWTRPFPY